MSLYTFERNRWFPSVAAVDPTDFVSVLGAYARRSVGMRLEELGV